MADHKMLLAVGFIIAVVISTHSWLVILTLYQQYSFLQLTSLRGNGPFAIAMHPNVAIIENGYNPTHSRSKVGVR